MNHYTVQFNLLTAKCLYKYKLMNITLNRLWILMNIFTKRKKNKIFYLLFAYCKLTGRHRSVKNILIASAYTHTHTHTDTPRSQWRNTSPSYFNEWMKFLIGIERERERVSKKIPPLLRSMNGWMDGWKRGIGGSYTARFFFFFFWLVRLS